jgi:threonine dehydratase
VRGAASKILALESDAAARGVVTASTGNHGRAVAYVASRLGIPVTVCVSENVPRGKITALEAVGCRLVVGGESQSEALAEAAALVDSEGLTLVHPFDDPDVIAGQGTIGLEIHVDAPRTGTVLVPLSGGGLASGVATALKSLDPTIAIVGVSMERAAVMAASLKVGRPVELPEEPTLADSLQGGIGTDNDLTLDICSELLDEVVLVGEDPIWRAMAFAFEHHRLILEGGGAVGIAALLEGVIEPSGPVAAVCSGANAEPEHVAAIAAGEGRPSGRADRDA